MPAWRAASPRELPSGTRARASIRREAAASRQRFASRRRSPALSSRRVTATVIVPSQDRTSPAERTGCDRERLRPCGRVRNRGRWYYLKATAKIIIETTEHKPLQLPSDQPPKSI